MATSPRVGGRGAAGANRGVGAGADGRGDAAGLVTCTPTVVTPLQKVTLVVPCTKCVPVPVIWMTSPTSFLVHRDWRGGRGRKDGGRHRRPMVKLYCVVAEEFSQMRFPAAAREKVGDQADMVGVAGRGGGRGRDGDAHVGMGAIVDEAQRGAGWR